MSGKAERAVSVSRLSQVWLRDVSSTLDFTGWWPFSNLRSLWAFTGSMWIFSSHLGFCT